MLSSTNSPSVYRGSTAEPGGSSKRSAERFFYYVLYSALRLERPRPFWGTPSMNRGGVGYFIASDDILCNLKSLATSFLSAASGRNTILCPLIMAEGEKSEAAIMSCE